MPVPSSKLRLALADGWPRRVLLFLVASLAYGASRWVMTGDEASALEHAGSIVGLEEASNVAVEASVQRALEGTAGLWLLNHAYLAAQVAVVPALGIADTITQQTGLALDSKLTTSFYNPLAAVPSLHCGFTLAVSLALAGSARRRFTRALALAWAPTIFLAVVATGNHFIFDIAAGITVTFGVALLVAARPPSRAQAPGTADRRAARARSRRWSPWLTSDASPPSSDGSWTNCQSTQSKPRGPVVQRIHARLPCSPAWC